MNDASATIAPDYPVGLGRMSTQNGLLRAQRRDGGYGGRAIDENLKPRQ